MGEPPRQPKRLPPLPIPFWILDFGFWIESQDARGEVAIGVGPGIDDPESDKKWAPFEGRPFASELHRTNWRLLNYQGNVTFVIVPGPMFVMNRFPFSPSRAMLVGVIRFDRTLTGAASGVA